MSTALMDQDELILGDNQIEDVSWLCSLSESELDLLMNLKALVLQRAKVIGHEELGKKFDLKMLRALGLVLMESLKAQVEDLSEIPDLVKSIACLDRSNLLKSNAAENVMSIEEIESYIGAHVKNGPTRRENNKHRRRNSGENSDSSSN